MITLRAIDLKDFLSHAETHIDLTGHDRILIDGPSGSGKSAIAEAITWGLYGVGRVDNRGLIRAGQKEATVTLTMVNYGHEYVIARTMTRKGKQTVEVTDNGSPIAATGIREIQEWIEHDFLHASYELFINSVVYPQDRKESFALATSVRRKELLLEILSISDIDSYQEKVAEALRKEEMSHAELTGEYRVAEEHYNLLETSNLDPQQLAEDVKALEFNVEFVENLLNSAREKRVLLQEEVRQEYAVNAQMANIDMRIDDLNKKEVEINEVIVQGRAITEVEYLAGKVRLTKLSKMLEEASNNEALRKHLLDVKPVSAGYDERILALEDDLKHLDSKIFTCPSGDDCPFYQQVKPDRDLLEAKLRGVKDDQEQYLYSLKSWERDYADLPDPIEYMDIVGEQKQLEEILSRFEAVPSAEKTLIGIRQDLTRLMEDKVTLEKKMLVMTDHGTEIKTLDETIRDAEGALLNSTRELAEARTKQRIAEESILQLATASAKMAAIEARIKETEKKIDQLEMLRQAFGANGIRAIAVDHLIPQLEDNINQILSKMSDFRIRLDTQKKSLFTKDGVLEGLFITIQNDQGQTFDFNAYSGGERLKITVAISEALAMMQKVGFRVVDELFVGLDEASAEAFVEVLEQIQGRFDQMFCISHMQMIKETLDKKLVVSKNGGISIAQFHGN